MNDITNETPVVAKRAVRSKKQQRLIDICEASEGTREVREAASKKKQLLRSKSAAKRTATLKKAAPKKAAPKKAVAKKAVAKKEVAKKEKDSVLGNSSIFNLFMKEEAPKKSAADLTKIIKQELKGANRKVFVERLAQLISNKEKVEAYKNALKGGAPKY